jgi:lipopolysaccharide biosynthesis regulator YciM
MEFEGWSWLPWAFVLAMVVFALGWVTARIDIKQLLSESRALPASYFKGLNFLLNEQQDKAIEAFIEVTKANTETVELQFALGSLFRRRGEVDRAIRVHQELSLREDLPVEQRRNAHFELAQDYLKAGLLDHAERILADLNKADPDAKVHRYLLDIYIQEREWSKAIDVAKQLEVSAKRDYQKEIANYYCELATTGYVHGQHEEARAFLDAALQANRKCVRATLLRGEWAAAEGRHEDAIEHWKQIEAQNSDCLGLAALGMFASYKTVGKAAEGLNLLKGLQSRYPSMDFLNVVYQATLEKEGEEAAYAMIRDEVRKNPSLIGLDKLLEAQIAHAPPERRNDLQLMKSLVHSHATALSAYLCSSCGFRAKQFYWHCPACGGWETFPPKRTAELDMAERHLAHLHMNQ